MNKFFPYLMKAFRSFVLLGYGATGSRPLSLLSPNHENYASSL